LVELAGFQHKQRGRGDIETVFRRDNTIIVRLVLLLSVVNAQNRLMIVQLLYDNLAGIIAM
jgi:hypothetical protein